MLISTCYLTLGVVLHIPTVLSACNSGLNAIFVPLLQNYPPAQSSCTVNYPPVPKTSTSTTITTTTTTSTTTLTNTNTYSTTVTTTRTVQPQQKVRRATTPLGILGGPAAILSSIQALAGASQSEFCHCIESTPTVTTTTTPTVTNTVTTTATTSTDYTSTSTVTVTTTADACAGVPSTIGPQPINCHGTYTWTKNCVVDGNVWYTASRSSPQDCSTACDSYYKCIAMSYNCLTGVCKILDSITSQNCGDAYKGNAMGKRVSWSNASPPCSTAPS